MTCDWCCRSSSRPEVASIDTSGDDECTNSVTVTAQHRHPNRVTTFLLAENSETGEVLRCDVIVDSITAIGIETTTRVLYLEDSPEKFQIWAKDSEGTDYTVQHNYINIIDCFRTIRRNMTKILCNM